MISSREILRGGIPQGTKLDRVLFAVMVNYLVTSWCPRPKYVDDLTVMEIFLRNSPSPLDHIVDDIHFFALNNNMKLNPRKCKTMTVDFLIYNSCVWRLTAVGGSSKYHLLDCSVFSCLRILPGLRTLTM